MGLFTNDIEKLRTGAANFLYIFVDEKATGIAPVILQKRNTQINELIKIYQQTNEYTFKDLVNIVYSGIVDRYGETPEAMLERIYSASSGLTLDPSAISGDALTEKIVNSSDLQKAVDKSVEDLRANVNTNGSTTSTGVWSDIANVITKIIELVQSIFGNSYLNPTTYSTNKIDWTGANSAWRYKSSDNTLLYVGVAAVAAYLLYINSNKNKKDKKSKKSKENG